MKNKGFFLVYARNVPKDYPTPSGNFWGGGLCILTPSVNVNNFRTSPPLSPLNVDKSLWQVYIYIY